MVKIMQLKNSQYIVTIPKAIAEAKNIRKGMEATWHIDPLGNMVLKLE